MYITKLFFCFFILTSCTHSEQWEQKQEANTVSIMAYNVENLFDTLHDKGTRDFSYLPKKDKHLFVKECNKINNSYYRRTCLNLDWNKNILSKKINNLATAILQVNKGMGPDILILSEVENLRVLQQLNKKLKKAKYAITHIEGFDTRGIDVAFFSRLKKIGKSKLHRINFKARNLKDKKGMSRSRGILESVFALPDGNLINIFGVHFPSPGNPAYWRRQAIASLNTLANRLPKNRLAIAGGDFNIPKKEDNKNHFYEKHLGSVWRVSHLIGCSSCKGTHTYKGHWSFLDALLIRKINKKSWSFKKNSVGTPNKTRVQFNNFSQPARFDAKSGYGTSDHFPIYLQIKKTKNEK
ncbi:MAG: endonuclease/exonuclease/phosphatase family protein [Bdellovibrionales bacterium]|nr:endonuclease/exonuclease/phosphatase family protein [Bdellovibrionales bacterium]